MSLLVARIGDGLAATPHLKVWLDALAAWPGSLAIAPCGGPFGAAARSASEAMGLNAVVAQKIALMAMDQYAVALAAVRPSPVIAETEDELRAAIASRRIAVWAPARMIAAASENNSVALGVASMPPGNGIMHQLPQRPLLFS